LFYPAKHEFSAIGRPTGLTMHHGLTGVRRELARVPAPTVGNPDPATTRIGGIERQTSAHRSVGRIESVGHQPGFAPGLQVDLPDIATLVVHAIDVAWLQPAAGGAGSHENQVLPVRSPGGLDVVA